MTTAPLPTWEIPAEPAWVAKLRTILRDRDHPETVPAHDVDTARQMQLSAAHQWLGTRAYDAGRAIEAHFSNTPDLSARALQSGGSELPQWTVTVWGGSPLVRARESLALRTGIWRRNRAALSRKSRPSPERRTILPAPS